MAIDVEKILTISVREYCEMMNKQLNNYKPRGIFSREGDISEFAKKVPNEAEVVIDYRYSSAGSTESANLNWVSSRFSYFQHGTALIPKNKD